MVGRKPSGFIADQIIPAIPVAKQSARYWTTNRKEFYRHEPNISQRAPLAAPRKVTFSVSSDTYFADNYALGAEWPIEDEVNAEREIRLAEMNAMNVTTKLLYDFEFRVSNLANAAANIATTTQVATVWSNKTGSAIYSNLIDNIETFRQLTGVRPNRVVIPEAVWIHVKRNDEIRDILFGDRGGLASTAQVANLLEVEQVLVPQLQVNTAGETETDNGSGNLNDLWSPHVHLFHVNPLRGEMVDTWGQALRWTDPKLGVPWAVRRFPTDQKRGAEYLDVGYYQDEKIVSPDLHVRIESVI
jgi:hypothetical protein